MPTQILEIALASPLRQRFDYLPPADQDCSQLLPGVRLEVPFGKRKAIGLLLAVKDHSDIAAANLKAASRLIDDDAALEPRLLELCRWSADYYMHPLGEVLFAALPPALRKGTTPLQEEIRAWRLSSKGLGLGEDALRRAPRRREAVDYLLQHGALPQDQLAHAGLSRDALRQLEQQELVESFSTSPSADGGAGAILDGPTLNGEQAAAVAAIKASLADFKPCLLDGITGSGKTEVYLQAIAAVLRAGRQALVLVPEIGLTPQTIARFEQRFPGRVAAMHSGLGEAERLRAWRKARQGRAQVVIGTRSAVFAPLPELGLVIVDEEHDTSYKQQEGFRFSARDVAVKRAQGLDIPIVLGSATPSAESLHNARQGRYAHLQLRHRAGGASAPQFRLLDLRGEAMEEGFSPALLQHMAQTVRAGNQVLVYINRRGFAPTLLCHGCGWVASCSNCDARMVVHRRAQALRCHHCDARARLPQGCPECGDTRLLGVGQGTERTEDFLQARFPDTPVLRIDRDTTRRKGAMDQFMARIHDAGAAILVGTQMLAKGHHFPRVTLVAVLDADAGLYSNDFRGPERTAQVLMQVAGRAGRAEQPGTVLIQTHQPDSPLLQMLARDDYPALMDQVLVERRTLQLPPFGYLAVVRSEAADEAQAEQLLATLRHALGDDPAGPAIIGPLPAPIARRARRYRFQLLLKHPQRGPLHQAVARAISWLEQGAKSRSLRWSVDIDPQDFV